MTIYINYQHPHHPGVLLLHLPALSGRPPGRILAVDGFPRTHRCSHNRISSGEMLVMMMMVVEVDEDDGGSLFQQYLYPALP